MSTGSRLSHSRSTCPAVSNTTPSPVRSLTSSWVPSGATAIGVPSVGLVNDLATRNSPSNATMRLESGSGAQERPPRRAAGERPRKRRESLGAAGLHAVTSTASSAAPSSRVISGGGCHRLDLDGVQPAHVLVSARHLHLTFGEVHELRVLRIAGLGAHRHVDGAVG